MKKLFFCMMAALATMSTSLLTACGSDADPVVTPTTKTSDYNVYFATIVTEAQTKYIDQSYVLNINGTTKTVKLSEMTETADTTYTKYLEDVKLQVKAFLEDDEEDTNTYKVYYYNCGNFSTGAKFSLTNSTASVKADRPTDEINVVTCSTFVVKNTETNRLFYYYNGINTLMGCDFNVTDETKINTLTEAIAGESIDQFTL